MAHWGSSYRFEGSGCKRLQKGSRDSFRVAQSTDQVFLFDTEGLLSSCFCTFFGVVPQFIDLRSVLCHWKALLDSGIVFWDSAPSATALSKHGRGVFDISAGFSEALALESTSVLVSHMV